MAGWTNKGKFKVLGWAFNGVTIPTNFYVALATNANPPGAITNTLNDLTEITAGTGYTEGGYQLTPNVTDFDVITEEDAPNNRGLVQIKDIVWTANGGSIPTSGDGARWAVLTDDNVTPASREVYFYWDLESDRAVSDGQTLTLEDCEIRIDES